MHEHDPHRGRTRPHRPWARCLASVLAALVIVAAGCGGEDTDNSPAGRSAPSPPPDTEQRDAGVEMVLEQERLRPGQRLRLTIRNRSSRQLESGVAYRLERWDGRWVWVNRDQAFIAIAKRIPPGRPDRERIELPGDLAPGSYRIVKSFRVPATDRALEASARFTVAVPPP